MRRFSVLLLLSALLALGQWLSAQGLSGRRAPSFSLPDSSFQQHDLLDYRGRWLFLLFVRTDNPTSKATTQLLESKKTQFGAKATVLSVAVSPVDNQATVAKYIADTKMSTPAVFDQGQMAASYFKATPAKPNIDLPHLFAINPNGMIVKDWAEAQMTPGTFGTELTELIASAK
jgi:peroxiredoxin